MGQTPNKKPGKNISLKRPFISLPRYEKASMKPDNSPAKMRRTLYLATQNEHKVEEFQAMLGYAWDVRSASQLGLESGHKISWDETGDSFVANSRIKALALRQITPCAVLADDSGLVVDALNGAPGIYSSRYAGSPEGTPRAAADAANTEKLLNDLQEVPDSKRTARFVCCLVFIDERGEETVVEGYCEGRIAKSPSGHHGFGYDPVFIVPSHNRTMAELSEAEKNSLSHRAEAVTKLTRHWRPLA